MSQIQQPPYSRVPWKGCNFLTKKIENRGCSYYVALDEFFLTIIWFFYIKMFPHEVIANQSEKVGMSQIQQPLLPRIFS